MTKRPAAMKNRCVAWEKKIETNVEALKQYGYLIFVCRVPKLLLNRDKKIN